MAEKVVAGDLFLRQARESVSSLDSDKLSPVSPEAGGEESSDSEGEQEGSTHKLIRKVSTSGQMRSKVRGAGTPPQPLPLPRHNPPTFVVLLFFFFLYYFILFFLPLPAVCSGLAARACG